MGNLSWAYSFGGSNDDVAKAVGVQYPSNQIVLAGSFTSSNMDFDPDTSSVYRSTKGGSDGFVSRFNRCFKDSLITIIGCDSVVGPSGNKSWYATGIYLDTIFSGCGGYAYVVNAIIPIDTANAISIKSCVGYASPSGTYYWTQSGTYKDTMFNGSYCGKDSINTIYLTIDTIPKKTYLVSECHEFVSPSKKYSWYKSGTYLDTVPAPNNLCDSVLTINLTILESYDTLDVEVCEQYLSPSGKYIYSKPGLYNDTLVNSNKCDSIITINLKNVFTPTFSTQNVSACNEYTSPSGKYKWVTNTIAKDTIANSHGCDSVITFNVTFGKSYSSANLQGCVPYLSPSTKHMWTMSGKQFDTISNHKGCDSIMVINFKALQGSSAQLTTFGCNTYTAPSGNHTWTSSGIYTDTLINSLGCDSILTIDLTIVETVKDISRNGDSLIMPVTGLKYQWLNCDEGYKKVIGATKPYLLPLDEAFYAVEIKNNECFDTSICLTTSRVGLETPTKHRFTVFPNPTSGSLNIQLADYVVNINCKISSIDGRLISEEEVGSTKNFKIELPGEIGLYMLTLYSNYELIGRALVVKK